MKPLLQTRFGGPSDPPEDQGNCWAACIASIVEIHLDDLPRPKSLAWDEYWSAVNEYLGREMGLGIIRFLAKQNPWLKSWPGHLIASGKSPNGDWDHCVVYRKGQLIHDPHPSKCGLVGEPHEYEAIVVL